MSIYDDLADSIELKKVRHNAIVLKKDRCLDHIGTGRSAVVFKIKHENKVLKKFYPPYEHLALEETEIYKKLKGSSYYPELYAAGDNFIVIDFIEGHTLFDCLRRGIVLSEKHIHETDQALYEAAQVGLTPSDVHLRNIMLTPDGRIKLVDVARFKQSHGLKQWTHLKKAYYKLYRKKYFPKKIPAPVLNTIANVYNQLLPALPSYRKKENQSRFLYK